MAEGLDALALHMLKRPKPVSHPAWTQAKQREPFYI